MITPLTDFPEGIGTLLAIVGRDHHQLSEQHGLDFSAVEEEMGTRYEAAFESAAGTVFTVTEPAYEPELGVQVHIAADTDARAAEAGLLDGLALSLEDLRWRALALQLNDGDIVSIDADAPEEYFPDIVGQVIDITYDPHPDLVPLPDVNPAVYLIRLDNGREIEAPSNFVVWEPILHAEAVNTAAQFNDFLAALIHHIIVRPHEWNVGGGVPGFLAGLSTRIAIRDSAAQQAREQLVPRWGSLAVSILESVAPASWAEEEDG